MAPIPRALALFAIPLAIAATPCTGAAQDAAVRARTLFDEGVTLSDHGDFEGAVERFRLSLALVERPSTLFNLAVALRELGRVPEAIAALERFVDIADESIEASRRAQASTWLASLRARGGTLVLDYDPPHATVRIDDVDIGQDSPLVADLAPGMHRVEVSAPGSASESFEVTISPGERVARRVSLSRGPERDVGWADVVGWVGIGAGAAAIGGAVAATIVREDDVARYDGPLCDPSTWGTRRDACPELRSEIDATTGIAITLWITGAALAGAGTAILVLAPRPATEGQVACVPAVTPRELGIGCNARF